MFDSTVDMHARGFALVQPLTFRSNCKEDIAECKVFSDAVVRVRDETHNIESWCTKRERHVSHGLARPACGAKFQSSMTLQNSSRLLIPIICISMSFRAPRMPHWGAYERADCLHASAFFAIWASLGSSFNKEHRPKAQYNNGSYCTCHNNWFLSSHSQACWAPCTQQCFLQTVKATQRYLPWSISA